MIHNCSRLKFTIDRTSVMRNARIRKKSFFTLIFSCNGEVSTNVNITIKPTIFITIISLIIIIIVNEFIVIPHTYACSAYTLPIVSVST